MDRRAGYAQPVVDIFVTILIIMVIIVFYMMFKWTVAAKEYSVTQNAATMDGTLMLNSILKSQHLPLDPSKPVDSTQTIAEYLQRDKLFDGVLFKGLNDQVRKVLIPHVQALHEITGCPIRLTITQGSNTDRIEIQEMKSPCNSKKKYEAKQLIPRPDEKVEVTLISGDIGSYNDDIFTSK
jgi:hypothetical protein